MKKTVLTLLLVLNIVMINSVLADESTGVADAIPVIPNATITGNFDFGGDIDYLRIDLPMATTLSVDVLSCDYEYNPHSNRCTVGILDGQGNSLYQGNSFNLDVGTYYLKISLNANPSWGVYSFYIHASSAPFNIAPVQDESLVDTRITNYHWTMVDGATQYQLNVSPKGWANYHNVLVDSSKNCNTMRGECQYAPKDFYLPSGINSAVSWRVIAKDNTGKDMVSSDHINFTVNNDPTSIQAPLNNINTARVMGQCLFGGYCARGTANSSAHNGVDFMTKNGTPVYAICDGIVKVAKPVATTISNRFTVIEHTCAGFTGKLYAYYGHITPSSNIITNPKVTKGQQIGTVAYYKSGGYDNSHLHFGLATKYFSNGWGYVNIGKVTASDCNKTTVITRRDSLSAKSWIDPASFGSAIGWGSLYLQGGAANGNCNAQKRIDAAYPVGNTLPYYPYHN